MRRSDCYNAPSRPGPPTPIRREGKTWEYILEGPPWFTATPPGRRQPLSASAHLRGYAFTMHTMETAWLQYPIVAGSECSLTRCFSPTTSVLEGSRTAADVANNRPKTYQMPNERMTTTSDDRRL
jgi:hypothetical protein